MTELESLDYSACKGVVLLGESALKAVLNDGHLKIGHSRFRDLNAFGPPVPVPLRCTFHPAAALPHRNPHLYAEIVDDLRDMAKTRSQPTSMHEVSSGEALAELMDRVSVASIDFEWREDGTITLGALSDGHVNIVTDDPQLILNFLRRQP